MMVDTGCLVTLLNVEVYKKWSGGSLEGLHPTENQYKGVTGGGLTVYGWKEMEIELAGVRLFCKVVVAGMALEGILGMNTMAGMGCSL